MMLRRSLTRTPRSHHRDMGRRTVLVANTASPFLDRATRQSGESEAARFCRPIPCFYRETSTLGQGPGLFGHGGGGRHFTRGSLYLLGRVKSTPPPLSKRTSLSWKSVARPSGQIRCQPLVHPIAHYGDVSPFMLARNPDSYRMSG